MNEPELTGAIVVDKPAGWTSHDVVARMRRIAKTKKIGHLGTLDPMATGVLPLLLNRATRLAQFFGTAEKVYRAVIRFGNSTDTYDREGKAVTDPVEPSFDRCRLEEELVQFTGEFSQMPPPVSAKKVQGRPAYELVRKNIPFELKAVLVRVHQLTVEEFDGQDLRILVRCSAGTYIRSIAHDLGNRLGCGAYLQDLRRIASGEFSEEGAWPLERLAELSESGELETALIHAVNLLPGMPQEVVNEESARGIRQGQNFRVSPFRDAPGPLVKAIDEAGTLLAIAESVLPQVYHPVCVL